MTVGQYGQTGLWYADYFEREVYNTYGDVISLISKAKRIFKFGRSPSAGTAISTVWSQGGNEVYLTDNTITKVTSTVASTTTIGVEGHTVDGNGDFTFVVQTVTLNGTADVALTTPLARCSRLYNSGSVALTGIVSAATAADVVYCEIPTGNQQSFKCATTISKDDYYALNGFQLGVTKKTAATAEFALEVREKGGVFRPRDLMVAASPGGSITDSWEPWIIVPPNSDIRVRVVASANSTPVAASFEGILASIIS